MKFFDKLIKKRRLIRETESGNITLPILFECCRLLSLNNGSVKSYNSNTFTYSLLNGKIHSLYYSRADNNVQDIELQITIDIGTGSGYNPEFHNIKVTVIRKLFSNEYRHVLTFKEKIAKESLYETNNSLTDEYLQDIIDLISLVLGNTIRYIKRWY